MIPMIQTKIVKTGGDMSMILANKIFERAEAERIIGEEREACLNSNGRKKTDSRNKNRIFLEEAKKLQSDTVFFATAEKAKLIEKSRGYTRLRTSKGSTPIDECSPVQIGGALQNIYHTTEKNLSR